MEEITRIILLIQIGIISFYSLSILYDDFRSKFLNIENRYIYSSLILLIISSTYLSIGDLIFDNIVKYDNVFQFEMMTTFFIYSLSSFIVRKYQFSNKIWVNNLFSLLLAVFQFLTITVFCYTQSELTNTFYSNSLGEFSNSLMNFYVNSSPKNKASIIIMKLIPLFIIVGLWYTSISRKEKENKSFEVYISKIIAPFFIAEYSFLILAGTHFGNPSVFSFVIISTFAFRIMYIRNIKILLDKSIKSKINYLRLK